MIICSCNALSDHAVRNACSAPSGPRSTGEVYRCLGCSPQCGRCARSIRAILRDCGAACATGCTACPTHLANTEMLDAAE